MGGNPTIPLFSIKKTNASCIKFYVHVWCGDPNDRDLKILTYNFVASKMSTREKSLKGILNFFQTHTLDWLQGLNPHTATTEYLLNVKKNCPRRETILSLLWESLHCFDGTFVLKQASAFQQKL